MSAASSRWWGKASGPLLARTCTLCHEFKQAAEFYGNRKALCGVNPQCKKCHTAATSRRSAERSAARTSAGLRRQRSHQHGLSDEAFLTLMATSRCAACGATSPGGKRGWHVDHDHSCCPGEKGCERCVRGLLCSGCNTALGLLGEDPRRIEALRVYAVAIANRVLENDDLTADLYAGGE